MLIKLSCYFLPLKTLLGFLVSLSSCCLVCLLSLLFTKCAQLGLEDPRSKWTSWIFMDLEVSLNRMLMQHTQPTKLAQSLSVFPRLTKVVNLKFEIMILKSSSISLSIPICWTMFSGLCFTAIVFMKSSPLLKVSGWLLIVFCFRWLAHQTLFFPYTHTCYHTANQIKEIQQLDFYSFYFCRKNLRTIYTHLPRRGSTKTWVDFTECVTYQR